MKHLVQLFGSVLLATLSGGVQMPTASLKLDSLYSAQESSGDTDPDSSFWAHAPAIRAQSGAWGTPVPGGPMEVRSRWTKKDLYFLFICPYEELHLKPNPRTDAETPELWKWDVAEVFIGADYKNIHRYREFEVSPQGEWIDLDVDLHLPHHEDGWRWNSGFQSAARIDARAHVWYAFMRIPYAAIDSEPAAEGNLLRANFFLSEGPEDRLRQIAWQPTRSSTFHVPEVFGTLHLIMESSSGSH